MTKASKERKRRRLAAARQAATRAMQQASFITIGQQELHKLQSKSYEPSINDANGRARRIVEQLIMATPGPADVDRALLEAVSAVAAEKGVGVGGLPYQDKASHDMLTAFVAQIEASCHRARLEPLPATVIGTIHDASMNAFAASFFGSTAVVGVHIGAFIFSHLLAKAVAALISRRDKNGYVRIGSHPGDPQFLPASKRLAELAVAFALDGNVGTAPPYICKDKALINVAGALRNGFEFFLVAHEYGHLMIDHGRLPAFEDTQAAGLSHEQGLELGADLFAMGAALWAESAARMVPLVLSPMVLMKFLSMLEKDGIRQEPTTHPPSALRLEAMRMFLRPLGSDNDSRQWIAGILRVSEKIDRLLEKAWTRNLDAVKAEQQRRVVMGGVANDESGAVASHSMDSMATGDAE
ncbi:MAG: hypothetical protein QM820_36270 [Minicystis sp.]